MSLNLTILEPIRYGSINECRLRGICLCKVIHPPAIRIFLLHILVRKINNLVLIRVQALDCTIDEVDHLESTTIGECCPVLSFRSLLQGLFPVALLVMIWNRVFEVDLSLVYRGLFLLLFDRLEFQAIVAPFADDLAKTLVLTFVTR